MGFPLHSNGAAVGGSESEVESEFQPADAGTNSQPIHSAPLPASASPQRRSDLGIVPPEFTAEPDDVVGNLVRLPPPPLLR